MGDRILVGVIGLGLFMLGVWGAQQVMRWWRWERVSLAAFVGGLGVGAMGSAMGSGALAVVGGWTAIVGLLVFAVVVPIDNHRRRRWLAQVAEERGAPPVRVRPLADVRLLRAVAVYAVVAPAVVGAVVYGYGHGWVPHSTPIVLGMVGVLVVLELAAVIHLGALFIRSLLPENDDAADAIWEWEQQLEPEAWHRWLAARERVEDHYRLVSPRLHELMVWGV